MNEEAMNLMFEERKKLDFETWQQKHIDTLIDFKREGIYLLKNLVKYDCKIEIPF